MIATVLAAEFGPAALKELAPVVLVQRVLWILAVEVLPAFYYQAKMMAKLRLVSLKAWVEARRPMVAVE
jgi:hypothetical protein